MNPSATKKSPSERHTGQEPNAIKRIITNHKQIIPDNQEVNINNDSESGQDSAIMVKERTRETKIEGLYKKWKGVLLENSNHTITFLTAGRTQYKTVEQETQQPTITPKYTIGMGKPNRTAHQTMIELKKRAQRR